MKRILAINFGGLGDEILFLPALISLKKEFPSAEITLVLEPRSTAITQLTDAVSDVITVDIKSSKKFSEIFRLITLAVFGDYDIVVSSGASPLISVILALTCIPRRYGYDTGKLSRLLLTKAVPLNKNTYAANMYHDLVKPVTDIKTELPEINVGVTEKIPNSVLVHPGVSKMSIKKGCIKTITPAQWAELIDKLSFAGKHVILAGGPDDRECIEEIQKYSQFHNFVNYYGKTKNVFDLAKLIASAEKFVCSDSAPLHIAVALGVEVYPFFGPTDDSKLVPQTTNIHPLKTKDNCDLKPCLWERRLTSCDKLSCLKYDLNDVVNTICS